MSCLFIAALLVSGVFAQDKGAWTDPADPSLPADFRLQGEYAGGKFGAQLIALGGGQMHAVIYPGGLPGAGWNGAAKILLAGRLDGDRAVLAPAAGERKYLAQKPEEFSATRMFSPEVPNAWNGVAAFGRLTLTTDSGKVLKFAKVVRRGPSMGAAPPTGAVVLFDGKNIEAWTGGRLDARTHLLNTDGKDVVTKRKFSNYTMHLEFMLPYRPDERGQGRGNSGFYQVDLYELQILDSFGLDGVNNECGAFYTKAAPRMNLCLAPLQWQVYDVDFTNAVQGADGKKAKNARATVRHNGVLIHEGQEIPGPTGGNRNEPEGTPGPIKLQGHGNPLQFRNIWLVEK